MFLILVICTFLMQSVAAYDACSSGLCDCGALERYADCSNRSLDYIPSFSKNVIFFRFENNLLDRLNKFTLSNITNRNISSLRFQNNKICCIDDTLGSMKSLEILNLSFNRIMYLNNSFKTNKQLKALDLSFNPLSNNSIENIFKALKNSKIQSLKMIQTGLSILPKNFCQSPNLLSLDLSKNNLKAMSLSDMKHCTSLTYLLISQNSISELVVDKLDHLNNLDISHNRLLILPDFCKNRTNLLKLQHLNIYNNSITSFEPEKINCLKKLRYLHLQRNYITSYRTNSFNRLPDLTLLHVGFQKNKTRLRIQPWAFNNSNLNKLSINSAFLSNLDAKSFFGCSNLKTLNLAFNFLSSNLSELSVLKHLQVLKLQRNHFKFIPSIIVENLHQLEKLDLSDNAIRSWDADTFRNATKLKMLYFKRNSIQTVTKQMFPTFLRNQLKRINLSENQFACTCEMVWFVQWMKAKSKTFISYPKGYHCLSITNRNCMKKKSAHLSLILVLSACIVILFVVILVYKYRCENTDQLN